MVQVAQELRLYRQSGGIQKQIERANQELALINMVEINYYEPAEIGKESTGFITSPTIQKSPSGLFQRGYFVDLISVLEYYQSVGMWVL